MKRFLISLFCAAIALCLNAQSYSSYNNQVGAVPGEISYLNGSLVDAYGNPITKARGEHFFQGEQYEEFIKATNKASTAGILTQIGGYIAGFAIGYPLGTIIAGGDKKRALTIGGIALGCSVPFLAIGFPMASSSKNTLVGIADDYNASLNKQSFVPTLTIGATPNGFGLALNF